MMGNKKQGVCTLSGYYCIDLPFQPECADRIGKRELVKDR